MTTAAPTLTLVRGAEYGYEIQGLIFPIRIVTSNAETLDQAIEQSNQAEQLVHVWNTHDALVKALTEIVKNDPYRQSSARIIAERALTAAGAEVSHG